MNEEKKLVSTVHDQRSQREREQYNEGLQRNFYSKIFSHCRYYYAKRTKKIISKTLVESQGKLVLEFGSSVGMGRLDAANVKPECLHCINISEKELAKGINIARKKDYKIKFCLMDATKLGFKENTFDIVFGDAILHHLDFISALNQIKRVLKPDGIIIFTEPLGINPIGSIIRFLTPKARTIDEQPLRFKELAELKKRFHCKLFYIQFFSVPVGVISQLFFKRPDNVLMFVAFKLDRILDIVFPPIRYFYRNILLIGRLRR
jgi:SAM-dependent methyltransferase